MNIEELKLHITAKNWSRRFARPCKDHNIIEAKQMLIDLTPFLDEGTYNPRRAWHIINDMYEIPKCIECGKNAAWNKDELKYSLFCSNKCSMASSVTRNKMKETNIERYGHEQPLSSDVVRKKIKSTNIERYGVEVALSNKEIFDRTKQSLLKNYGVEHSLQNEILLNKMKETNKERYGVEYIGNSEEIKNKAKMTNLEKYGVEYPLQSKSIQQSITNKLLNKYGVFHPRQIHIDKESLILLADKDWLIQQHHDNGLSLTAISNTLNVNITTVANYFRKHDIRIINTVTSSYEIEIQKFISEYVSYVSNTRQIIPPLELDIYIPDKKLAIEFNGLHWHSELYKDKDYHFKKYYMCNEKGVRLIQIFEDEWIYNKELVKTKILHLLGYNYSDKIYARKTNIIQIGHKQKQEFFDQYHIQGDGPSSLNYGLEYEGSIVACIGFNNNSGYILNRYATSCNVIGGFTKLLSYFEKQFNYPKIITFADLRWSEGKLYFDSGFKLDKILNSDYAWVINDNRVHKFNFRHTTGLKHLEYYDSKLSETENMHNHGFYRIYDAGKLRFTKNI